MQESPEKYELIFNYMFIEQVQAAPHIYRDYEMFPKATAFLFFLFIVTFFLIRKDKYTNKDIEKMREESKKKYYKNF